MAGQAGSSNPWNTISMIIDPPPTASSKRPVPPTISKPVVRDPDLITARGGQRHRARTEVVAERRAVQGGHHGLSEVAGRSNRRRLGPQSAVVRADGHRDDVECDFAGHRPLEGSRPWIRADRSSDRHDQQYGSDEGPHGTGVVARHRSLLRDAQARVGLASGSARSRRPASGPRVSASRTAARWPVDTSASRGEWHAITNAPLLAPAPRCVWPTGQAEQVSQGAPRLARQRANVHVRTPAPRLTSLASRLERGTFSGLPLSRTCA